jgi:hypothetical protein
VSFAGHLHHNGREFGLLEFKLPETVESLEQLKAFLAHYLREAITTHPPKWIAEGLALSHLLPWHRKQAAYEERDRCVIRRSWLQLALKDLAAASGLLETRELVSIGFDGALLTISCGKQIIVQAEGSAWRCLHRIQAGDLKRLPTRLKFDPVEVSAWDGYLAIGNFRYRLASLNDLDIEPAAN